MWIVPVYRDTGQNDSSHPGQVGAGEPRIPSCYSWKHEIWILGIIYFSNILFNVFRPWLTLVTKSPESKIVNKKGSGLVSYDTGQLEKSNQNFSFGELVVAEHLPNTCKALSSISSTV